MFAKTDNEYHFKYLITGITGNGIKSVFLPSQPADKKILFKREQKFVRPEMPEYLQKAVKEWRRAVAKNDQHYVSLYSAEIKKWEDQEWDRADNGLWFWNNGVATYITGFYYWYLTAWKTYFGIPIYRESDKEITYFIKYCEEDPDCYGLLLNTIRRYGKSSIMGAFATYRTTRNFNHYCGMQGEKDDKIAKFYDQMIKKPFKKLPYYFKPTYDTSSSQTREIKFERPAVRGKNQRIQQEDDSEDELESIIEYRPSGESEYDGYVLHTYIGEEPGKCHPKGTKVLMYDGSIKNVEDVNIGDKLRGDDNTHREVLNIGHGVGKIYKIIPNSKAEPWYVNEHHILSCKISGGGKFKGYKKGDVVNISLKTYLGLTPTKKKHLMCYRVGVEYDKRNHLLNPYFIGLWLGDGSSVHPEIANKDTEVIEWLKRNYNITVKKTSNGKVSVFYAKGGVISKLKTLGLYRNKHIPKEYLIDSRENRLQLLAGLIDTDGHRCTKKDRPNQRYYEITQKNKRLAHQIHELSLSLGFYASIVSKEATMKRPGKATYKSTVYRVSIFGQNLYEIPCLIARKKMPRGLSTYNSKDPMVYGFTVEYDRIDDYYGFNISGNRLYLLSDYTVTHNTLKANIHERWKIVKPCLRKGRAIRGFALMGTTVEFMDSTSKGGRAYKKLFFESDVDARGKDGRTTSGMYASFLPGDTAYEDFLDEWGHPMRQKSKESILMEREAVKNNPKDFSDLVRKYPLFVSEIFYISADKCVFNAQILQARLAEINMSKEPFTTRGEFYWVNSQRFGRVSWRANPVNGWCQAAELIKNPDDSNQVGEKIVQGVTKYFPKNQARHSAGVDPVDHRVHIEGKMTADIEVVSSRRSKPVMFVKRKYDTAIDGELSQEILEERERQGIKYPYKTNRYVIMMDTRTYDPNVFNERALMICWYHGCEIQVENQKPGLANWFYEANCEAFLQNQYIPLSSNKRSNPFADGTAASTSSIQEYTDLKSAYIQYFGHTIPFRELIEDDLVFQPHKTQEHDYSVAGGWTEVSGIVRPKTKQLKYVNIEDLLPSYDEYGIPQN